MVTIKQEPLDMQTAQSTMTGAVTSIRSELFESMFRRSGANTTAELSEKQLARRAQLQEIAQRKRRERRARLTAAERAAEDALVAKRRQHRARLQKNQNAAIRKAQSTKGLVMAVAPTDRLIRHYGEEAAKKLGTTFKLQPGAKRLMRAAVENFALSLFRNGHSVMTFRGRDRLMGSDFVFGNFMRADDRMLQEIFPSDVVHSFRVVDGLQATEEELQKLETPENQEALKRAKREPLTDEERAKRDDEKRAKQLAREAKKKQREEKAEKKSEKKSEEKKKKKKKSDAEVPVKRKKPSSGTDDVVKNKPKVKKSVTGGTDATLEHKPVPLKKRKHVEPAQLDDDVV